MVIAFANNQGMTTMEGTSSIITTDPVALNGNDRATANFNVHYLWATVTSTTITYQAQVSNDGVHWVDVTALTDNTSAPTGATPLQVVATVNGAFIRFRFTLSTTGANGLGGVGFDLHVKLDHV